jgi:hypothetical protein
MILQAQFMRTVSITNHLPAVTYVACRCSSVSSLTKFTYQGVAAVIAMLSGICSSQDRICVIGEQ